MSDAVPDYGAVAGFAFTDQTGRPFGSEDLKGKVWIADFVFTRCMGPCPLLTTRMAALQTEFKNKQDLMFVSFSVDPDHDTPAVLTKYATTYGVDGARWKFLTGPKEKIYQLIHGSFHLAVGPGEDKTPSVTDILHSLFFVLVDKDGRVRGYFNSDDEESMKSLREKIRAA